MIAKINTEVFPIQRMNEMNVLDLTRDFDELQEVLHTVLNRWNEVQVMNTAIIAADTLSCFMLQAMAETIITVCRKARENGEKIVEVDNETVCERVCQ